MKVFFIKGDDQIPAILESYGLTVDEAERIVKRIKRGYNPKEPLLPYGAQIHSHGRNPDRYSFGPPALIIITLFMGVKIKPLALAYNDRAELVMCEDKE